MEKLRKISSSLFRELKRRRVGKTSLLYVVLCWGALEVADVLFSTLDMDADMASQILLYSAVAGFPLMFALAWFFQITSQGIVRTIPFVNRRVLNNMEPINDRRHEGMATYFRDEDDKLQDHWFISIESGALSGLSYSVSQSLQIGRTAECDLTLPDSSISRHHARLYLDEDTLMIEDLGSANGTLVNGSVLEGKQALRDGDELLFHDILFRVSENYAWGEGKASALNLTTFVKPVDESDAS